MSLHPQHPIPPVPDETARIARAAFPKGNPYLLLREQLGGVFADGDFADLYSGRGQPSYPPWRLALVTLLQFREGFSDRQAAEAVRARIDWKHLLGLELTDPGFDHSVLCEFRSRLLAQDAEERLLTRVLDAARALGLLKARGRQRTDATHVLASVRDLNRLELVAETLRAALNALASTAPDWLRALAPADWYERYGRRIEDARLPETAPKREAYTSQVGHDGFVLLAALDKPDAPHELAALPAIAVLRRVWACHFEPVGGGPDQQGGSTTAQGGARFKPVQGRALGDRIESPYDAEARFRAKTGMSWTGYMMHLTETCDEAAPRLVIHVDTTAASVHEALRTGAIHDALATKELTPSTHLVDAGYVSASHLVEAHERHNIDLAGPPRPGTSWHDRTEGAFRTADFSIDWDRCVVRCPEGKDSTSWTSRADKRGRYVKVRFSPSDCRACLSRTRCTKAQGVGRQLALPLRPEHEALIAARARQDSEAGRRLYALRAGIEGTLSQAVRAFGLRQARYRGLAKTRLQNIAIAAALNLDRISAWLSNRPLAPTRTSRFAALAA